MIKTQNLSRSFRTNEISILVIDDLSFTTCKGEFTVIMGNSGSGKSTLLYLLSGLDKASSGTIWIDGFPVHDRSEKELARFRQRKVGFVFQDNNLIPNLTIKENILVAGYLVDQDNNSISQRIDLLLNEFGIRALSQRLPSQVSGGELQRCAIARAIINNPSVIMADEPTGSLNSEASERVLDCFTELHSKGQSILMATHDLKSALRGDKVLFFRDGKIVNSRITDKTNDPLAEEQALFNWLKKQGW